MNKRGYLEFFELFTRFYSQQRRLLVHIQKRLDNEILRLINEALSEFLQFYETLSSLVQHFNVFSRLKLTFLQDSLLVEILAHFVRVNIRIILANFPYKRLESLPCGRFQESLLDLKHFFFNIFWSLDVKLALDCGEQELFVESLLRRQTYCGEYSVNTALYFASKSERVLVVNYGEGWVADPRINQFLVEQLCLVQRLISCLIIRICVKLGSSVCC